ncbi:hypothetical protein ACTJKN_25850 [Pedobacter sp. 22163]|uniref:hypothetical protein n=1 Tax=Pedobacter sp. 22163 TaxID=3453883 RepID=UPI003F847AFD
MKRTILTFADMERDFHIVPTEELNQFLGGITFDNWLELLKYIAEHGIDDNIKNTHWELDGAGGLNRIDIVQKDNQWGFYATSGNAWGSEPTGGAGSISVNVNSTWVPVTSTLNNGATAYLEAINKIYQSGSGYIMGYKTGSDITYENFWNRTFNLLTSSTIGAMTGGVSSALEGIFGTVVGGAVMGSLENFVPALSVTSEADKVRNDIVLATLQNHGIANYTPGMTMGGTVKFTNTDLDPFTLTIDMRDLMKAMKEHMVNRGFIDSEGEIDESKRAAYMSEFNQLTQNASTLLGLTQSLGGLSTRGSYPNGGIVGGGGSTGPVGPGYTEPLPDGTYLPMPEPTIYDHQPEFFIYNEMPDSNLVQHVSSDPISFIYPYGGGFVENDIWTDENGDRWLMIFCENMNDPHWDGGVGSGARWAASKLNNGG